MNKTIIVMIILLVLLLSGCKGYNLECVRSIAREKCAELGHIGLYEVYSDNFSYEMWYFYCISETREKTEKLYFAQNEISHCDGVS